MIAKLARFCFRRRRTVLGAWIVLLVVAGALQANPGADYKTEFGLPSSESRKGFDVLEKSFGANGGGLNAQFVFEAEQGVTDPAVKAGMEKFFAVAGDLKGLSVTSPYSPEGSLQMAQQGELAGKLAFADVNIAPTVSQQDLIKYRSELIKVIPKIDGLKVLLGGQAFGAFEPPETELIGLAFAVVILILAFGSVLAMGLPIGTAIFGIFVGSGLLALATQVLSVPDFTPFVGIMIGLGVGIDYALFIITRYRDGLRSGLSYEDATVDAMDSAGRAVLFAGITVIISVLGMWVMGLAFIQGLAVGASVTVLAVLAASMTLLPALLGFAADEYVAFATPPIPSPDGKAALIQYCPPRKSGETAGRSKDQEAAEVALETASGETYSSNRRHHKAPRHHTSKRNRHGPAGKTAESSPSGLYRRE